MPSSHLARWRGRAAVRATPSANERGFTLLEILVTLAVMGIIIALVAAALRGRVSETRVQAVASQVVQVIGTQQELYKSELRSTAMGEAALAARLNTALEELDEVTSVTAEGTGTAACTGAEGGDIGIIFTVVAADLDAGMLQTEIHEAVTGLFEGIDKDDPGGYVDVFGSGAGVDITDVSTDDHGPPPSDTAATSTIAYLCINDV